MALKLASAPAASALRTSSATPVLPVKRSVRCLAVRAQQQQQQQDLGSQIGKAVALSGVAASWMVAGHASAATELAQLAASDNRLGIIATLFVPALGWVGFNILQPALTQLDKMNDKVPVAAKKKRGVAAVIGLGAATLLAAQQADAATELATVAASDNRLGIIATLFVPALGWVGFNILQPALTQLDKMNEKVPTPAKKKRGVAGAIGLGAAASLLAVEQADAATELAQLAASDNRLGIIATLFVPALAWVGFNILQPALTQLDKMNDKVPAPAKKKRSVAGAIGLGAASLLAAAQSADAATELATVAASDNRLGIIATLFVPALGWVAFNILSPALTQLDKMSEKAPSTKRRK